MNFKSVSWILSRKPGTEVRLRSSVINNSLDWEINTAKDTVRTKPNSVAASQKWIIENATDIFFRIRHADSDQFLVGDKVGNSSRVYMSVNGFGSFFTFEDMKDGTVRVHLAEIPRYLLEPEDNSGTDTLVMLWPGGADKRSEWRIEPFLNLS
ncbi:hypothetical protein BC629DRAFT_1726862 [Irpex lacteus]|nr:hypothetical protein BC629DRAFT_1726862 [Irpex lacteus]